MDGKKTDSSQKMVKLTIKRADDSPDNNKWVCKRIVDDPELEPPEEKAHGPSESLPADDENLNEEPEDYENWYHKIPSYLEVEVKEVDHQQPFWGNSTENDANVLETQHRTYSYRNADSANNTCNDPTDLSGSYSKQKPQRDVQDNVSNQSPIGAHSSKGIIMENVYGGFRNTPSLTGRDGILQGEASHFPRAMLAQNTSTFPNERLMNSGEVIAMPMKTIPSTSQNFSMTIHKDSPITSGFIKSEKPKVKAKGKIPNHMQQGAPKPLETNHRHFIADDRDSDYSRNAPNSNANKSCDSPLSDSAPEKNANNLLRRNECTKRIRETSVNDLSLQSTNHLKLVSQTCEKVGSNDLLESVKPPKRKKSHSEVPRMYHCNICNVSIKTSHGYQRHLTSERHLSTVRDLGMANPGNQQPFNLYNFHPGSVSRPFGPAAFETQPQPHPHLYYLMANQMRYQQMYQAYAMAAANQFMDRKTLINNAFSQNYHSLTPKSDCIQESLGGNRSQNDLETKCYAQDPRLMNLPVNHTSNPQSNLLLPGHPQSENSKFADPKYLENNAPKSSSHEDSSRIQPENSNVRQSVSKSEPCVKIPNQPENVTMAGSFRNSEGVQSEPSSQSEFFPVYVCLVCSTFHTDDLEELERHVSIDRKKTPYEFITASGEDFWCQICNFKVQTSGEMGQHLAGSIHLNRVDYYNHVMEGDFRAKEKLDNVHEIYSIYLCCNACEFPTTSMETLKIHSIDPIHQHNASCCMHFSKFRSAVEYCYCRPCRVRTATKRELLLHVRSRKHLNTLQQYPSNEGKFHDPAQLFFIKELGLNINEAPSVSEQTEGRTFNQSENPHSRKESDEKNDFGNPAPLDLSSKPSNLLRPLPVSCTLCQQVLPEINVLVQHLQRIHGVSEAGVKWITSNAVRAREEKFLLANELSNTETGKPKGIVFPPLKSSATYNTLQGTGIDSSSPQSSLAPGHNLKSKSSTCVKAVTSEQSMPIDKNVNPKEKADENSSSSQMLYKKERKQNPVKKDRKTEREIGKDFSASQQPFETKCKQNKRRSRKDSSASQQFYEKEEKQKSAWPIQNPVVYEENIPPVGEEKVSNSEENLNFSSQVEVIVENASGLNRDSKSETKANDSSSNHFSATEHELLISELSLNARRKENNSSPIDRTDPTKPDFYETENIPPLGEEKVPNSEDSMNSCSSQAEVIVEYGSDPNRDGKYETDTDDSMSEDFSTTGYESKKPPLDHNVSRKRNKTLSRDHNSVTPKRLQVKNDSSIVQVSPVLQSDVDACRERNNSLSDNNAKTPERLLAIYDSSNAHTSPMSPSTLYARGEWFDSSPSDHHSVSPERSLLTVDSLSDDNRSPMSQSDLNMSRERNNSSLNDRHSLSRRRSPSTDNFAREHFSITEHESPKSRSGLKTRRKRDDIFAKYERLPVEERKRLNLSPSQHNLLDSNNRSPSEDEQYLNLREDVVNNSTSRLVALVESKQEVDNFSSIRTNSVNGQIALYECPNEYEAEFSATHFPVASDLQIQAGKNIENIEISGVFSLRGLVESSSNSDEEEDEDLDIENIEFSDPEDL